MEELKDLLKLIGDLPTLALWVLAGFWAYKVICVGSIYGVIRFCTGKLFDWLQYRKTEYKEVRPLIDGMVISGTIPHLISQIGRCKGRGKYTFGSDYIHKSDVHWLECAITSQIEKDAEEEREKKKKREEAVAAGKAGGGGL